MKHAHERFGELVYIRRSEKTRTHIRVHLNAWIGEESKAHLISVVGGDTEIGALAAAFASHDPFAVVDPDGSEKIVSLGESPTCFRGALNIAGRKRPLKHLVALSQEMIGNNKQDRLLLIGDEPAFVWSSLVLQFGLPAVPDWADWFFAELNARKKMQHMTGLGYTGIAVKTDRQELLRMIEQGLRKEHLGIPSENGSVCWLPCILGAANRLPLAEQVPTTQ
jgi:hypothetical protein